MADGCIFCAIVRRDAPAHVLHEDEHTITFLDLFPVAEGHTLIVSKDHFENLFEGHGDALAAVGRNSIPMARAIRSAFTPDGMAVYQANGTAAGQTVFHYHMHLIPRNEGTPMALHGRKQATPEELDAAAVKIGAELAKERGPAS